jgi:hypothetical protein
MVHNLGDPVSPDCATRDQKVLHEEEAIKGDKADAHETEGMDTRSTRGGAEGGKPPHEATSLSFTSRRR